MVSSCPGGRGVSTNSTSHQLHLQLFGARRWTLCATSPTPARETWECQHVTLRRGDLLYVPPGLRHYASAGAALSAHLTLQLQPLTLHELLSAAGGGGGGIRPSSLLAEPLPLWRNANATCLAEMCPSSSLGPTQRLPAFLRIDLQHLQKRTASDGLIIDLDDGPAGTSCFVLLPGQPGPKLDVFVRYNHERVKSTKNLFK
eukprot:g7415.t1